MSGSQPEGLVDGRGHYQLYCPSVAPCFLLREVREGSIEVQDAVLTQHLYEHLSFTIHLELGPVAAACDFIASGGGLANFPDSMRQTAVEIRGEEAEHGDCYERLQSWAQKETGLQPVPATEQPAFLARLDRIRARHLELSPWVTLFFTIISETLITKHLSALYEDRKIHPVLRSAFRQHAEDEARHRKFFTGVLDYIWGQLTPTLRSQVTPILPYLLKAYLVPDQECLKQIVEPHTEAFDASPEVLAAQVLRDPILLKRMVDAAQPTGRIFRKCGIMAGEPAELGNWLTWSDRAEG